MIKNIVEEIDTLSQKYDTLFQRDEDIKALQGIERCIEMKMKACGVDGKNNHENNIPQESQYKINLEQLPTELLHKLLEIINLKTMKK